MKYIPIKDIMSKEVVTLDADSPLYEVIRVMQSLRISCVVLMEHQRPVGIFTERDAVKVHTQQINIQQTVIGDIMTRGLITVTGEVDYADAYQLLMDHKIRHLVVTTEDGSLCGLVSESDFVKHIGNEFLVQFKEVNAVMNNQVKTLSESHLVSEALAFMADKRISCVVVERDSQPVGIFTERDVVSLGERLQSLYKEPLIKVMHSPVQTVVANTSIHEALEIMDNKKFRRLVIADEQNRVAGILTRHDIVKSIQSQHVETLKNEIIRQETIVKQLQIELVREKELKRARDLLVESQRIAKLGSWELTVDTNDFSCSDELLRIFGLPFQSEAPSLQMFIDYVHPDDKKRVQQATHSLVNGCENDAVEYLIVLDDGSQKYIHQDGRSYCDDSGEVYKVIATIQDITNTKESEIRLRKVSEDYGRAQKIGNMGNWRCEVATKEVFWSDHLFEIFGREPQPVDFDLISQWVHPEDQEAHANYLKTLMGASPTSTLSSFKSRIIQADGQVRWIRIDSAIEFDVHGSPELLLGTVQDITKDEETSLTLKQYSYIFENLSEGITISDEHNIITNVNPAFSNITGYTKEDAIGKDPSLKSSGYHPKAFYEQMWSEINQKGAWQGEIINRRKDGRDFPEWLSISSIKNDSNKVTNYISVFSDISSIKKKEDELRYLAHHDPLTALPNRMLLLDRLKQSLERAKRDKKSFVLMFIDLDRFKNINDTYGHDVGDRLLIEVANRLESATRGQDTVARISGDEFVVLMENIDNVNAISTAAQKLIKHVAQPIYIDSIKLMITASIGIAKSPEDGDTTESLMKNADMAVYKAKDTGRNNFEFYSEEMAAESFELLSLSNDLQTALENEEFELYYQSQVDADQNNLIGVEALLRWNTQSRGQVQPENFISLLEDSGMIIPIGEWVLREACLTMKNWLDQGRELNYMTVNVSGKQLADKGFPQVVEGILKSVELDAGYLEIEVAEHLIMKDVNIITALNNLKTLGVKISIDNFGTGYSSLQRLRNFPIDKIKIDRTFIKHLPQSVDDVAITNAVISLASNLGLEVMSEGVESRKQMDFLVDSGCNLIQGYLFTVPVPKEKMEALLNKGFEQ